MKSGETRHSCWRGAMKTHPQLLNSAKVVRHALSSWAPRRISVCWQDSSRCSEWQHGWRRLDFGLL